MNTRVKSVIRAKHTTLLALAIAASSSACAPIDDAASEADDVGVDGTAQVEELGESQQALGAQDSCNDILKQGIADTVSLQKGGSAAHAAASHFCKEEANSASGGGSVSILWGLFGGSGGGSASSYDKLCKSYRNSSSSTNTYSLMTSSLNTKAIDAWKQCMLNVEGLSCYKKEGEDFIHMRYVEQSNSGKLVDTAISVTNLEVPDWRRAEPSLRIGNTDLLIGIPNRSVDSSFGFNGATELTDLATSCTVTIKSPVTLRKEMAQPWTDLAIMYRDLASAVDALTSGAPNDVEIDAYNMFVTGYWGSAVKSNECSTGNEACITPPIAKDYTFSLRLPGLRCTIGAKNTIIEPGTITLNVLTSNTSAATSLLTMRNVLKNVWQAKGNCNPKAF